ncbi:MAG: fumarate hydratase [Burkholderiaceae bacterium]|nr:fumarate hydratase [Rhodoferax sp.]MCP5285710.1 fumarate hydratase [Burkholderiaceae bacterium]
MPVTYDTVRRVSAQLYDRALRKVPDDTQQALQHALPAETDATARATLRILLQSADQAERQQRFVCSDAGVPVYFVRVGTAARLEGAISRAFTDGFADLVAGIQPPLLAHVTNPLTLERGHAGRHMPLVSWNIEDDADWVEITCSPKALGSGRWAALEIFSFPNLDVIERYVLDVVAKAGSQPCPPVVVGVGIGGSFDHAAALAKRATLRPVGQAHDEPMVAAMEERLLAGINRLGFGPMGTGGDTTAMAVHVDYSAGHGFTPVAVCFNCWINRRTRARLYNDGRVDFLE